MKKKIFKKLEKGMEREIDKMPYNLPMKVLKKLVNKALDRVIKKVGSEYDIPNADTKELKEMFWFCNESFPNFDDECYISLMRGMRGNTIRRLGAYKEIKSSKNTEVLNFTNDILYDGKWGANYCCARREMLGGYSSDGVSFRPDFRISELEIEDLPNAIVMCSVLYPEKGKIDETFEELAKEFSLRNFS